MNNKGFTLLEIMLVIAIIAALMILGISAYDQKIKNNEISTASIEMQTWLQAALRFYTDHNVNGQWPKPDPNKYQSYAEQIIGSSYMQTYQTQNPWGEDFIITPDPDPLHSNKPTTSIIITTTLPQNLNQYMATMIAARVPFATVDKNTDMYKVILQMPLPANIIKMPDKIIVAVKTIDIDPDNGNQVSVPVCQANYTPEIHVGINSFTAPYKKVTNNPPITLRSINTIIRLNETGKYWQINTDMPVYQFDPNTMAKGTVKLMVITMCEKFNPTTNNKFFDNNHYLF